MATNLIRENPQILSENLKCDRNQNSLCSSQPLQAKSESLFQEHVHRRRNSGMFKHVVLFLEGFMFSFHTKTKENTFGDKRDSLLKS